MFLLQRLNMQFKLFLTSDTCLEESIKITLSGYAYESLSFLYGTYQKQINGSLVYWLKNDTDIPTALWYSQSRFMWMVGKLEDLLNDKQSAYLSTQGSSCICPYTLDNQWAFWNGEHWLDSGKDGKVSVMPWKDGK